MDVFQLYRFTSDLGRLVTWMEMTEDKLASVSETSGEDKALLINIQVCIYYFLLLVILKVRFFAHCSRHGTNLLRKNSSR